jgi:hypothetical protein
MNAYGAFIGIHEGKRPLGRFRHKFKDRNKAVLIK